MCECGGCTCTERECVFNSANKRKNDDDFIVKLAVYLSTCGYTLFPCYATLWRAGEGTKNRGHDKSTAPVYTMIYQNNHKEDILP